MQRLGPLGHDVLLLRRESNSLLSSPTWHSLASSSAPISPNINILNEWDMGIAWVFLGRSTDVPGSHGGSCGACPQCCTAHTAFLRQCARIEIHSNNLPCKLTVSFILKAAEWDRWQSMKQYKAIPHLERTAKVVSNDILLAAWFTS